MVTRLAIAFGVCSLLAPTPSRAAVLEGPGRFCGFSPIIDLQAGERIETLAGGIHSGAFRWSGPFGTLYVSGIAWAGRPQGKAVGRTTAGNVVFAQRKLSDGFSVTIWNGSHGVASFSSESRLTKPMRMAIDRVRLFDEGDDPEGCKLRTIFVWE